MTTQTELFPKTTMEVLESLRAFHVADVEKAGTALDNLSDDEKIARRYEKAEERLGAARELVRDIDRAIDELKTMDSGVLDTEDLTVTASATLVVDPITGEVDDVTSAVSVTYPGESCRITDVGSRTQYGELVADYLATLPAVSPHRDDPVVYYRVTGVDDEIDRELRSPVSPDDYGVELAVLRRVDVQEANELLEDAVR